MSDLIVYKLPTGASIAVQTAEGKKTTTAGVAGLGVKIENAEEDFEKMMDNVKTMAESILDRFTALTERADKMSIEFGIALGAKAGVILTSGYLDANLKISLCWEKAKIS